jgi:site-specific recombinase XerD
VTGAQRLPDWEHLAAAIPDVVAPMRRYLQQLACILRPGSVSGADQALRSLAAFLADQAPDVRFIADIRRHQVEDFRTWLAARPGHRTTRLTPATLAHRLGTLRMFFVRISDWDWPEAPPRVPIIPADLPRQDHPLPKALDDPAAAKLLRSAQTQPRMLVRVVVEVLLRTGLRVGEFTALQADAVVLIGAAHWLHVPVGKLRTDRYLPLHPHLVTLIDDYRTAHVAADNPLLLPRENGRALDRHTVTRLINKAGAAAGLGHIHPHQLRHTLATQAINRGMTLEAIAALLGHRSLDMTLRYAKIANRTVADEYFAVTEKGRIPLPARTTTPRRHHRTPDGPATPRTPPPPRQRLLHPPTRTGLRLRGHCETCTFFQTNIEFRPTLLRQRDHAAQHDQPHRADLFNNLLTRIDDQAS